MPLEVVKANDLSPTDGMMIVVAGPGGLGKSTFAGTAAEFFDPAEVLVLATLAREVGSAKYQEHNLDIALFEDPEWLPEQRQYKAQGFNQLLDTLMELREDDHYKCIILDNGTEAGELAWRSILGEYGVGSVEDLPGKQRVRPYVKMSDQKMPGLIARLMNLTKPRDPDTGTGTILPKTVIVPWHVQPKKEGWDDDTQTADQKGEGVEYEGNQLPRIRGGFRRALIDRVDAYVYADRIFDFNDKTMKQEERYVIQVRSDHEKHCKLPGFLPKGVNYIDNDFGAFMDLIQKAQPTAA